MSNIKRVDALGYCPFDFSNSPLKEHSSSWWQARANAFEYLGCLHLPSRGLEFTYLSRGQFYIPSDHGGRYSHYTFQISGEEAYGFRFFEELIRRFEAVGCRFTHFRVMDIEGDPDNLQWESLILKRDELYETLRSAA